MNRILASHKIIGVVFLALILTGIWFTGAIFSKKFTDYDKVTLEASNIGLALPSRADVKIRGVIVGEVLETKNAGGQAELVLGLYPDQIGTIPENVTARIEPKTLFGEKYVALQVPAQPSAQAISAGDRITQTVLSTEVEEALNDLYPLLRTVSPGDLNKTLTALATALEGRGDAIGNNLEVLDDYLKRMNPQLPKLVEDIKLTGQVSEVYNDVIPEIASILRNSILTGNTLTTKEKELTRLFRDVSKFSGVTGAFLAKNEENLVRVAELGDQQLRVLAKYAPEFPCLVKGIVGAGAGQSEAFRGQTLHINLEVIPNQPRKYGPQDKPRYGAKNGPYCGTLPNVPYNQANPYRDPPNFDDGVDEPTGKGIMRALPSFDVSTSAGGYSEAGLARGLLAAQLGEPSSEVSDLGVLLYAPLLRGTEVSAK
ncbi:MCE family protein [Nocardioides dubius]|uniref:MCE family protein n=1 Tax=Nocardioides dubius TaxID=317019 RepID=A0ABP4E8W7_9ACTN